MKLLVFAASHRPGSYNRKLANLAAILAQKEGASVDFAEYHEFDTPFYNDAEFEKTGVPEAAQAFAKRVAAADGMILATPEYNWSYPGNLKNTLDWTSRLKSRPLAGKTALLLSATPGSRGGVLAVQHLKSPLEGLLMHVFNRSFQLSRADQAFDGEGHFTDAKQQQLLVSLVKDYVMFTTQLRKG